MSKKLFMLFDKHKHIAHVVFRSSHRCLCLWLSYTRSTCEMCTSTGIRKKGNVSFPCGYYMPGSTPGYSLKCEYALLLCTGLAFSYRNGALKRLTTNPAELWAGELRKNNLWLKLPEDELFSK